ncbi:hypothetical protein [Rhizobium straminoryzae]|uniref:hypothetical protein n=1 Tax=Rhizobium straminoryzae TaxID=1387186 RepID=UPI003CCC717C
MARIIRRIERNVDAPHTRRKQRGGMAGKLQQTDKVAEKNHRHTEMKKARSRISTARAAKAGWNRSARNRALGRSGWQACIG